MVTHSGKPTQKSGHTWVSEEKGKRAATGKGKNRQIGSLESIGEKDCDGIVMNGGGSHSLL